MLNLIPLPDAIAWCAAWRDLPGTQRAAILESIKAFLIPHNDLHDLLSEEAESARSYFGIDYNSQLRILIVGVDSDGNDMCEQGVFDFTKPCPPTCASNSPLMQA